VRRRAERIEPLRRVDVWEILGEVVDDLVCAGLDLRAERNVLDVRVDVIGVGAAEEEDAKEEKEGQ